VLKAFAQVPTRIYIAVFLGQMMADYMFGGMGKVVQSLPIRLAIFAGFITFFWRIRRRARAFR